MTKFESFCEFVMENMVYPLVLSFVAIVVAAIVGFTVGEVMWVFAIAGVIVIITALWLVAFLVAFTAEKISDYRYEREWTKQHPEEE